VFDNQPPSIQRGGRGGGHQRGERGDQRGGRGGARGASTKGQILGVSTFYMGSFQM